MPDPVYGGVLTDVGAAAQTAAHAAGTPWRITHMLIGDAGGAPGDTPDPVPAASDTALVRLRHRLALNRLYRSPLHPTTLIAEAVLPPDIGDWWQRELGLEDANGNLVGVANCPPSFKPLLSTGSGRTQTVRMHITLSSFDSVELTVDSTTVLASLDYVDEWHARDDWKQSVRLATTASVTLSGTYQLDGVALEVGWRVLVKNQLAAANNGIYIVAAGAWVRAGDADNAERLTPGLTVAVEQGSTNGGSIWQLINTPPIVLGTTALDFEMVSGRTGVVPGQYTKMLVNRRGQVTWGGSLAAGDIPTLPISGISGLQTALNTIPALSNAVATAPGVASAGNSAAVARANHVHPPSPVATTGSHGLMAAGDKSALDWLVAMIGTGMIEFFAGATVPPGRLPAYGSAVSRSVYAGLFGQIGTIYGAGDGWSTFHLPDLRAEFLRGLDAGRGVDPGRALGSGQKATLVVGDPSLSFPAVVSLYNNANDIHASFVVNFGADVIALGDYSGLLATVAQANQPALAVNAAGGGARPRNVALLPCIRY